MNPLARFWYNLPIKQKGTAVVLLPALCLVALLLWIAALQREQQQAGRWVRHSEQVRVEGQRLGNILANAEASVRGYNLSRRGSRSDKYLEPYYAAQRKVEPTLARLEALVRDNPAQAARLRAIRQLTAQRLTLLAEHLRLASLHGPRESLDDTTLALVQTEGRAIMEALRKELDDFLEYEETVLAQRTARLHQQERATGILLAFAALVGVLGGFGAASLFSTGIAARLRLLEENADRLARGEPFLPVPAGRDEISRLHRALGQMAERIQERETRLRESRDALFLSNTLQQAILEGASHFILSTDVDGAIRSMNPAAERALGYPAAETVGRLTPLVFFDPAELAAHAAGASQSPWEALVARARAGSPDEREWCCVRRDGSRVPVLVSITALRDAAGQVTGFLFIGSDVTERRRAAEALAEARDAALAASRAKSDFLATMSHEIRTPLNAIVGTGDLLWSSPLTEEQREYCRIFRNASEALLNLIDGVLDLAKVESGSLELDLRSFSLRELAETVVETLALRAHEKGLEITCLVDPAVAGRFRGDPDRLRQILYNLLGNAIKFTEAGEVVLRIEPDSAGLVRFTVTDTGIGIPPDKQEMIFHSFTQADTSTTRRYGGTGLGLAISRRLVELMGGRIGVESEPGQGSRFHFTARLEPEGVAGEEPAPGAQGLRVLVVDDSPAARQALRDMLAPWGAVVAEAGAGAEALTELRRAADAGTPYRLLLLDSRMPGTDGFEVARHVLQTPSLTGTTVMMLTTDTRGADAARLRELGLRHFVVKPLRRQDLAGAVTLALGAGTAAGEAPTAALATAPDRRLRVLVVDDAVDNRLLIRSYLKDTPHEVDTAEDGEEAISRCQARIYDLVLMDVRMPRVDGYSAARRIHEFERARGRPETPIVALTAHALTDDVRKSAEAGCIAHLTKPVRREVLLQVIQRFGRAAPPEA
ncbi:MAG TPA: response regulator, partial [Armatimonadota bacterium]|nr:response regulator [Armatimonadota bacterium]